MVDLSGMYFSVQSEIGIWCLYFSSSGGENSLQHHERIFVYLVGFCCCCCFTKASFMLGSLENFVSAHFLGMVYFTLFGMSLTEGFGRRSVLVGLLL